LSNVSKSAVGSTLGLSLGPAGSPHPFGLRHRRTLSTPFQDGLRFLRPPFPPPPSPVLAVGIPPSGGARGAYPVDKREEADEGGWGLEPGGSWGHPQRELRTLCASHSRFGAACQPLWPPTALRAFQQAFTHVHPFHPPLALGRVRLPAFGTLSPELRTLDYAAARLGRGTWMPQGPMLGTSLLVLMGFDGVRPSRPLVATQQSVGCKASPSGRNAARMTLGGEFPTLALSIARWVPSSPIAHVSASPPLIPDGRLSRGRLAASAVLVLSRHRLPMRAEA
jgi:hypothetical protein